MDPSTPATSDPRLSGIDHEIVSHGPVESLAEAAEVRGVTESALIKTMVVRISDDSYVFVLVPGDRVIDWGKLRNALDVNRLSLPDEKTALEVTGYARGTITPFGSTNAWPVHADQRLSGSLVNIGGGAKGVSISADADDLFGVLGAAVADLTKPARPIDPSERGDSRTG